ncbi:alpha/beta hydrolase [Mycobacterium sp.]|jgi:pimeloyl-ACP methyl ester carboxylesterase|uniref:alpha/beta fold hydrolase n=1 Tax=Mycobacterium sp. TaxID=1785 RepID=UPI002D5B8CE3|nr:alpha/beta hydrolase [Mycobacterium sp.]HZA08885.1 alpha/beta hydrolase [Mycobacterium sp.]
MPTLTTHDGTSLFFTDQGAGPGVVFTHAWALNSDQWHYVVAGLLDAGLRCVTYDRRGHGRSDRHGGGWDMDLLADDLARLIEHLDLKDVLLLGHSTGCSEIVRYLTRHGRGRVARAVFLAPILPLMVKTADNPDGIDPAHVDAAVDLLKRDVPQWCADNAPRYFGVGQTVSAGMADWTMRQIVDTPVKTLVDTLRMGFQTDFRDELRAVDVPTLLIHGDADASAPIEITGRKTAALLPDAKLIELPGVGHGLYITHAQQIADEVRRLTR